MNESKTPGRAEGRIVVAVLAAGHGKRMRSAIPKHLHEVAGMPIVERVIRAGLVIRPAETLAIVGPSLEDLPSRLGMDGQFRPVIQDPPLGTADAVRCALEAAGECDWLVSLLGDSPLLTGETVQRLVDGAIAGDTRLMILTCLLDDAASYGRIERDGRGNVQRIVELKNDQPELRQGETEINSGIMVLDARWARQALAKVVLNEETQEFLLTDLVELAVAEHQEPDPWPVETVKEDPNVALGVNDRRQQADADAVAREQVRDRLLANGVTIVGRETVFIDDRVEVDQDTVILPGCVITGWTRIGRGCRIGPHAVLHNAVIGDDVQIASSTVRDSSIGHGSDVGPYAHLRGNTRIGAHVHVGSYAEMKNTEFGDESKCGHFSYLGDTVTGRDVNIGAGTVTANFDGESKHPTRIGDRAFVGSDSVLVAPVTLGEGARTGAGAVVTRDVAPGALVVGMPARVTIPRSQRLHADADNGRVSDVIAKTKE